MEEIPKLHHVAARILAVQRPVASGMLDRALGGAALRMMSRNMSARVLATRQWHNEIP
jgi:hypothetical protein